MFTEYALNGLLKQTYARAPFLPLSGRPTPTPVGRRERRVYITGVNSVTSRETSRRRWKKSAESLRASPAPPSCIVGSCESNEPRLAPSRFPRPIRPADLFARPSPASPFISRRIQNPSPPTSYNKLWKRVVAACSLLPERGEKTTRWCRVE